MAENASEKGENSPKMDQKDEKGEKDEKDGPTKRKGRPKGAKDKKPRRRIVEIEPESTKPEAPRPTKPEPEPEPEPEHKQGQQLPDWNCTRTLADRLLELQRIETADRRQRTREAYAARLAALPQ
jgi:hypothetical protein